VKKLLPQAAAFQEHIDKLTRSIENARTGESFPTQVRPLTIAAAKKLVTSGWSFDWAREAGTKDRRVHQLNTIDNPQIIHGLISLEAKPDHIFMHLVESAAFNKGRGKVYLGVLGNLVAFACCRSFELGHEGFVSFESKSVLKAHYKQALGAAELGGLRLYLGTPAATALVKQYYPNFFSS